MVKNLRVFNSDKSYRIDKKLIHKLVNNLKDELNFSISSLLINFVNTEQITGINKKFLNHHYSTDIITFNYTGSNQKMDGEIFISCKDAEINAYKFNNSFKEEYLRLVIHGILHLLGYDDMNKNDKKIMKQMENGLLNKYKIVLL